MEVRTIAVIGAGTMGKGIAYAAALGGFHTVLFPGFATHLKKV
jgi:3-hydroxyacyl-CoA dehydrogenase